MNFVIITIKKKLNDDANSEDYEIIDEPNIDAILE